jgi:hypothetical protein
MVPTISIPFTGYTLKVHFSNAKNVLHLWRILVHSVVEACGNGVYIDWLSGDLLYVTGRVGVKHFWPDIGVVTWFSMSVVGAEMFMLCHHCTLEACFILLSLCHSHGIPSCHCNSLDFSDVGMGSTR